MVYALRHNLLKTAKRRKPRSREASPQLPGERRGLNDGPPADDQAIDEQQDYRTDDRANPARRLLLPAHEGRSEEAANERAGDAEEDGNDPATRVSSRHQELGDGADDETEQQPSDDIHV